MDPATETLVTVGASEALTCAFLGLVNRGDEVILFDPQVQPRLPSGGPFFGRASSHALTCLDARHGISISRLI